MERTKSEWSRTVISVVASTLLAGCITDPQPPGMKGTCPMDPCANGVKDGDESDVDCGGSTCPKCAGLLHCDVAADCFSGNCMQNVCYGLADVTFADAMLYPSSDKPYAMLGSDLDGDGAVDLAVANEIANTITVFRNDGTGSYMEIPASTASGFPTGEYPTGGAVADMNGDGVPDIVTANYHGNSVSVLLGSGTGSAYTLSAAASYPTAAGAETSNLAVGDLNRDGIPDVIATNPQAHSASVFLGRAGGTLGPAFNIEINMGMSEPYSVAIGDFNRDGINDAAIADNRTLKVYVELGSGDGTFALAPAQPKIGGEASFIIVTHDMDLDGVLDLVVANRYSDNVSILHGHGDGTFNDGVVSSAGPGGPYSLAIADFNLDSVPDVVTANFMTGHGNVMLGTGTDSLGPPIDTGMTGMASYGVAAADFNKDGKPDFATANAASNNIAVKISTSR